MREELVLNVFVGESGDRLVVHLPAPTEARRVPQALPSRLLFNLDSWKDCREIITKARVTEPIISDGACSMNFVEFCKENGAFEPTSVECCPNVDLMARKALRTEKSVSALMAWPS